MVEELSKEEWSKWADYWYYTIGVNPIPVVSKAKVTKKGYDWKEWQTNPLPEETFKFWKAQGAYCDGIGVVVGKVWRGENKDKYLIFVDCDNKKSIEEICTRKGERITLQRFAEKMLVEQHKDNPDKAHIYFYSDIPFPKKSSDVLEKAATDSNKPVDIPLFEVKGKGSHGMSFCTPSTHQNGHRYEIIGTSDSITFSKGMSREMMQHLDSICRKYGLHYLDNQSDSPDNNKNLVPMESLYSEEFRIHKGNNRHEALLRFMESVIKNNKKTWKLPFHLVKEICKAWNNTQCVPPLDDREFEKQWKSANEFIARVVDAPEAENKRRKEEESNTREQEVPKLIEQFRQPNHGFATFRMADLGVESSEQCVVTTGNVIGVSELLPSWKTTKWECKACFFRNEPDLYSRTKPPKHCENCGAMYTFFPRHDATLNEQTILIQDEDKSLSCLIDGPRLNLPKVKAGQKVKVLGFQRYKSRFNKRLGENEWIRYFEALDVLQMDGLGIRYDEKDVSYFKELASIPNFIEQILVPSFAPHVRGKMDDCKLVCIYTLASQGLERPFNAILLGPPARGKTQLVEYTSDMSHHGNLTTFVNTSVAGLTTETVVDPISNARMAKPGILATYSLAAFTDLNGVMHHKEGQKLMLALNDALERKVVTSAKAGGAYNFEGRCAVLMDSNNFQAKWFYDEPVEHNLQFAPKSFISRIDLIGLVPEGVSEEHHQEVGQANYRSYRKKQNPIQLHEDDWIDEATGSPRLGFESLKKFFFYVLQQELPELPDDLELERYFGKNYVTVLKYDQEYLVDGRYNRTVLILARVRARLMLKTTADKSDIDYAINFVNKCKNIETVDPKTGTLDANYILGSVSKSEIIRQDDMNKIKQWVFACKIASERTDDGFFTQQQLIDVLLALPDTKWTDLYNITSHLERFQHEGKMMQKEPGRYGWID